MEKIDVSPFFIKTDFGEKTIEVEGELAPGDVMRRSSNSNGIDTKTINKSKKRQKFWRQTT